jgi:hypothetical protein
MADTSKRNRMAGKGKNKKPKSNLSTGRKYDYDAKYQQSPERVAYRVELNRKNRELQKKGKSKVGDNKDVSHKKAAKNGGTLKNGYRLENKSKNRARKTK